MDLPPTPLPPRTHTSGRSRLVAYDFGAHLAEWSVDGQRRIWLSEEAVLDGSAPIRGGVPICFPWFAAGPHDDLQPAHGVVRTARWRPVDPGPGEIWAWEIGAEDVTGQPGAEHVPGPFLARYAVSLRADGPAPGSAGEGAGAGALGNGQTGEDALFLTLQVTNTGPQDYRVEAALHTYLAVADVRRVRLLGLEGAAYLDKVTGRREVQRGPVVLDGETDRVFDRSGPVVVEDPAGSVHHEVRPAGAAQTVVWNPWAEKAAAFSDLGDDEWTRFVCVETAARGERALMVPAGDTVEVSCGYGRPHSPAS